ncbi:MAG TPA: hypothetical protein ENN40_05395 [Candidatus Aminicenantes bacterium]|nr:hypothetical protein [Candidatus Aminicenantes bacterium]
MMLAVLILNREELLESVLEGYLEIGITGATIVDSVGMGHILAEDVPVFAGLRFMFSGNRPYNKTVLSVIQDEKGPAVKNVLKKILGPLEDNGNGILFFIPVIDAWGLKPEPGS